jgi:hypothetical protein
MGAAHFLAKRLERVKTEMSLHVLAYNLKRLCSASRRLWMLSGCIPCFCDHMATPGNYFDHLAWKDEKKLWREWGSRRALKLIST